MNTVPSDSISKALASADERLRDWNNRCRLWYSYHYAAGVLGIILSCAIAAFAKLRADELNWLFWVALVAALLQGVTTFFSAKRKAAAYRAGWRTLWVARERLQSGVEPDPKKLYEAIEKGWKQLNAGEQDE